MARGLVCQRCAAEDRPSLSFAGRVARWRTPWLPVAGATRHPVYVATVGRQMFEERLSSTTPGAHRFNVAQARPSDGVRSRSRHVGRALPGGAPVPVGRPTPAASIHRTSHLLHEVGHGGEEPARDVPDVARALEDPMASRAVRRVAPLGRAATAHGGGTVEAPPLYFLPFFLGPPLQSLVGQFTSQVAPSAHSVSQAPPLPSQSTLQVELAGQIVLQ